MHGVVHQGARAVGKQVVLLLPGCLTPHGGASATAWRDPERQVPLRPGSVGHGNETRLRSRQSLGVGDGVLAAPAGVRFAASQDQRCRHEAKGVVRLPQGALGSAALPPRDRVPVPCLSTLDAADRPRADGHAGWREKGVGGHLVGISTKVETNPDEVCRGPARWYIRLTVLTSQGRCSPAGLSKHRLTWGFHVANRHLHASLPAATGRPWRCDVGTRISFVAEAAA